MDIDELQRAFFEGLYTNRILVFVGSVFVGILLMTIARRLGWFASARLHPMRTGLLIVFVLGAALPFGYYTASPLWIRTELVEPDPAAVLAIDTAPPPVVTPTPLFTAGPTTTPATPIPTGFVARRIKIGRFAGTDDFHFGRGTASIIEIALGRYHLRLDDFSVRNGPDLYVYLSPDADDYAKGAIELGKLKATDGDFGYDLPAGTDPADFASAVIWCKQFSHLFAVAPLAAL